jgi:hypothetical protein
MTGRSSLARPAIAAPALRSRSALPHCSRPRSSDRACCRLVDSGSAGCAGGRVLAPHAPRPEPPERHTPQCSAESRRATTSDLPRKPGSGTGVAGSYMSLGIASTRPVDPADRPPDPKACPLRELPRSGDQSGLWTTPCRERKRERNAHQPPLEEACFRVKHGATPPRAGHPCQRRRRLQAINRARARALSWGQLLARTESVPPLPRSAGPQRHPRLDHPVRCLPPRSHRRPAYGCKDGTKRSRLEAGDLLS